jgi:hypothetical protein
LRNEYDQLLEPAFQLFELLFYSRWGLDFAHARDYAVGYLGGQTTAMKCR